MAKIEHNFEKLAKNKKNKISFFFVIFVIFFVILCGKIWWEKFNLPRKNAELREKNEKKAAAISKILADEKKNSSLPAEEILARAEKLRTKWSEIWSGVLKTQVETLEAKNIKFENFSTAADGKISATGTTDAWSNVINLLQNLSQNPRVKNAFVQNLSRENGEKNVKFNLVFEYSDEKISEKLPEKNNKKKENSAK